MYASQPNKKMSESNSTTLEIDNQQLRYYEELEKHINALSKNFREKSVIKQNVYCHPSVNHQVRFLQNLFIG